MKINFQTAALALACAPLACALNVTILADTNRDGIIDAKTDAEKKDQWTETRGALFLPNIGDSGGRCTAEIDDVWDKLDPEADRLEKIRILNNATNSCNDASDNVQRNPKYLAPILVLANCKVSASATGSVHVTNDLAAKSVRIFQKDGDAWKYIAADHIFTAQELRKGMSLGVERVFTTASLEENDAQAYFVQNLEKSVAAAGLKDPVYLMENGDIWTQDYFETGYASIPGPDGPVVIRILIRSAQWYRPGGIEVFERLRSDSVGAVQELVDGDTIDSMGNLETIPPYTHNGKSYPAGRIIMGAWDGVKPLIFSFLEAQGFQAPLALDTSWLYVGHVDEFLQFLPADNKRGWILMADDPHAGLELLKRASRNGHGGVRAVSRSPMPGDYDCLPIQTVDQILALADLATITDNVAARIEGNLATLKRETGLTDAEIFRVPATFYPVDRTSFTCGNSTGNATLAVRDNKLLKGGPAARAQSIVDAALPPSAKGIVRRQTSFGQQVSALFPGAINGIVLTNHSVLAPNPWGPVIDGVDIIAEAVTAAYARASFKVAYMDNWFSHHMRLGEVHCGSNTWRDTSTPWWE
ncbi:Protein-arginine deiminase type-4 like protein [Verticillium longisporum]|nr:Protein-arginine deiminase type-4 like protein [Verticillium longisporum]